MERGKTDVGHLLLAENEALPGPGHVIVRLQDIRGRQGRCECVPRQRKPKSSGKPGGTQCRRGSGFGRASPSCSLLHPCHGRFPRYVSIQVDVTGMPVPPTNAKRRRRFLSARAINVRCRFRLPSDDARRNLSRPEEHLSTSEAEATARAIAAKTRPCASPRRRGPGARLITRSDHLGMVFL